MGVCVLHVHVHFGLGAGLQGMDTEHAGRNLYVAIAGSLGAISSNFANSSVLRGPRSARGHVPEE